MFETKDIIFPSGTFQYKGLNVKWSRDGELILQDADRNRGIGVIVEIHSNCMFHYGTMVGYSRDSSRRITLGNFFYMDDDFQNSNITLQDKSVLTGNPLEFMCDRYITEILG